MLSTVEQIVFFPTLFLIFYKGKIKSSACDYDDYVFLDLHSNNPTINTKIPQVFQKGRMHTSHVVGCGPDKGHPIRECQKHMSWLGWPESNTKCSSSTTDISDTSNIQRQWYRTLYSCNKEVRMKFKPSNTTDRTGYCHTLSTVTKPSHKEEVVRPGSRQEKQQV